MSLTNQDLQAIGKLMKSIFRELIEEEGLVTKKDISHLPTKKEFYQMEDKLLGEVKAEREENDIITGNIKDLRSRVTVIESHLHLSSA